MNLDNIEIPMENSPSYILRGRLTVLCSLNYQKKFRYNGSLWNDFEKEVIFEDKTIKKESLYSLLFYLPY